MTAGSVISSGSPKFRRMIPVLFIVYISSAAGYPTNSPHTPLASSGSSIAPLMSELDDGTDRLGVGTRQDPMTDIEDMARPSIDQLEDLACPFDRALSTREHRRGIQVPLYSLIFSDQVPCLIDRESPVDPDPIAPSRCNEWK